MFHLCAYSASIDTTANVDIAAVVDDILTIQNSHFLLPQDLRMLAIYAGSATLIRARMSSPKLRQITQPQIRPINVAALPAANPNVSWYWPNLLTVRAGEELAIQATANPGTTERFNALLWLVDQIRPIPPGDIITLRATSTTACVANAWTTLTYTLDDQIPAGTYAMLGSECVNANGIAHRWIMDGVYFRPGGLCQQAVGSRTMDPVYMARWGEWGRFRNTSLPRLQCLNNSTDNAHTMYMNVVQVSGMAF